MLFDSSELEIQKNKIKFNIESLNKFGCIKNYFKILKIVQENQEQDESKQDEQTIKSLIDYYNGYKCNLDNIKQGKEKFKKLISIFKLNQIKQIDILFNSIIHLEKHLNDNYISFLFELISECQPFDKYLSEFEFDEINNYLLTNEDKNRDKVLLSYEHILNQSLKLLINLLFNICDKIEHDKFQIVLQFLDRLYLIPTHFNLMIVAIIELQFNNIEDDEKFKLIINVVVNRINLISSYQSTFIIEYIAIYNELQTKNTNLKFFEIFFEIFENVELNQINLGSIEITKKFIRRIKKKNKNIEYLKRKRSDDVDKFDLLIKKLEKITQ